MVITSPIKRATTSLRRTSSKALLLLVLITTLGSLVAGAISVRNTVVSTELNLRRSMPPLVSITTDWEVVSPLLEIYGSISFPPFTVEQIQAIGALPQVNFYDAILRTGLQSRELVGYTSNSNSESPLPEWFPSTIPVMAGLHVEPLHFSQGFNSLITGRFFEEAELVAGVERSVALISADFAAVNGLNIGSVIDLYRLITLPEQSWEPENIFAQVGLEFEIIGIFEVLEHTSEDSVLTDLNRIFVPIWTIEYLNSQAQLATLELCDYINFEWWSCEELDVETNANDWSGSPFFILNDPLEFEDFNEAGSQFISELMMFETMSSRFDDISTSMITLLEIADLILYGAIAATILILTLLITLFLYDRRREIGIYLALGEKRKNIIIQLLSEVVIVAVIGITLALFIGNAISSSISQEMINTELVAMANQRERDERGGRILHHLENYGIPMQALSVDEMLEIFDTSLSTGAIALFFMVGIGTVAVSTIVPLLYVVKLEPKKVLL